MVEKDKILVEEFRFNGVANFKDAYDHAHGWLSDEDYDITEEKYEEVAQPGEAKELRIKWVALKKTTDYFRINLEINWQLLNMRDVEVEINGEKKKMNKFSELKINIKGSLEKDYSAKWGAKGFNRFLKELYNKYIIPQRTEEIEDKVRSITRDFKEEMKAFLNLSARR